MKNNEYKVQVFTGIRPSGGLTIANAIGAVNTMVTLQKSNEIQSCMVFVADLHALTDAEPGDTQENVLDVVKDYIALGLDPKKNMIFIQSALTEEIAELNLYLSRLVSIAELMRVPTLKEKIKKGQNESNASALLAMYPVMMASDILLQKSEYVPVGEDQVVHIEFTRVLAQKFNKKYGNTLPIPKVLSLGSPIRVKSLTGNGKMSKSDPSGAILLDDPIEVSLNKIKRAQTAFAGERSDTLDTLVLIGEFVSDEHGKNEIQAIMKRHYDGENVMGELKKIIMTNLERYIKEYQERKSQLNEKDILKKIKDDGAYAKKTAQETISDVRKAMGLRFV
jgi:tryptophanyl-tRNA synthetase